MDPSSLPAINLSHVEAYVSEEPAGFPLFDAQINDTLVTPCLRDTGSSICIIRSDCLPPGSPINPIKKRCRLADGSVCEVPETTLQVISPYFTGTTPALIFNNACFPFLLGNIRGALLPTNETQGKLIPVSHKLKPSPNHESFGSTDTQQTGKFIAANDHLII